MGDALPRDEGLDLGLGGALRDGKTQARRGLARGRDVGVDADELALVVEQAAARVARVDGRVSLNHVGVDRRAAQAAAAGEHVRAVERRDDTGGEGLLVAVGTADGRDPLPDRQIRGIAPLGHRRVRLLYLDDGQVAFLVVADAFGFDLLAAHADHRAGDVFDHVVVRDDVAVGVVLLHDNAGAERAGRRRAAGVAKQLAPARARVGEDVDGDDAAQVLGGHGLGDCGLVRAVNSDSAAGVRAGRARFERVQHRGVGPQASQHREHDDCADDAAEDTAEKAAALLRALGLSLRRFHVGLRLGLGSLCLRLGLLLGSVRRHGLGTRLLSRACGLGCGGRLGCRLSGCGLHGRRSRAARRGLGARAARRIRLLLRLRACRLLGDVCRRRRRRPRRRNGFSC